VDDRRHDNPVRSSITPQFIGDQPTRHPSLDLQWFAKKEYCCMLIAARLHENIYHVAVLVNSTPQVLPFPPDCYEEFIHVPDVT
jgi:hypothetical protein